MFWVQTWTTEKFSSRPFARRIVTLFDVCYRRVLCISAGTCVSCCCFPCCFLDPCTSLLVQPIVVVTVLSLFLNPIWLSWLSLLLSKSVQDALMYLSQVTFDFPIFDEIHQTPQFKRGFVWLLSHIFPHFSHIFPSSTRHNFGDGQYLPTLRRLVGLLSWRPWGQRLDHGAPHILKDHPGGAAMWQDECHEFYQSTQPGQRYKLTISDHIPLIYQRSHKRSTPW